MQDAGVQPEPLTAEEAWTECAYGILREGLPESGRNQSQRSAAALVIGRTSSARSIPTVPHCTRSVSFE